MNLTWGCRWLVMLGVLFFHLQYIHICYFFIYRSRWKHEFWYFFFCLKILFNVNGKATVWLTHPLFSFVYLVVMLRASKQWFFLLRSWYCWKALDEGQSELTATNTLVGRFVHQMGCVFSFGARWGSSQLISFCCWPLYFYLFFWFLAVFPGLDLTHTYPAHFPTIISIAPTLSQPHFGQVWGWIPTLPKLGFWSPPGLPNV
jgi:hypothetical protein